MTGGAERDSTERRDVRRGGWLQAALLGLLCSGSFGCPPSRAPDDGATNALGSRAGGGAANLDVRRASERPALTLLVREGDPQAAVAAAVAVGLGPKAAVALSTLTEQRLQAAGYPVRAEVDRFGFRLVLSPALPAQMDGFVAALVRAFSAPVVATDPAARAIAARWAALERHRWREPALEALAECTGELGVLGEGTPAERDPATPSGASVVDGWRKRTLAAERAALAAVGPAELGDALARALEQSTGWPRTTAPWPASPARDVEGGYFAADTGASGALLTVAMAVADPHRAASAAVRLGEPGSPLRALLASSLAPWELAGVRVTVTPAGGCIAADFAPGASGTTPGSALARGAADVARLARIEAAAEVQREADPFVAVRSIIAPAAATDAASRAAWWSLAARSPSQELPVVSALGVRASRGGPGDEELRELERAFRARLAEQNAAPEPVKAEHRLALERGQGELWALVGSRCGTADETPSESGLAALGAIAAAVGADGADGVRIEPWLGPSGVGVLAHALPRTASETPRELAERVGRAAGRAFATGPATLTTLVDARRRLLEAYGEADATRSDLARAALPSQASRLAPLGPPHHGKQADLERAKKRWRAVMRGPIRIAVLANSDLEQARQAAEMLDRWLVPIDRARACDADRATLVEPGRGGLYHASQTPVGGTERLAWATVVLRPDGEQRQLGELTVAALDGPDGLLAAALGDGSLASGVSVRLVEWADGLALIIELDAARGREQEVDGRVTTLFETLREKGLGEAQAKRAVRTAAAKRAASLIDPRARVEQLWSGTTAAAPGMAPAAERWRQWLADVLRSDRVVRIRGSEPAR